MATGNGPGDYTTDGPANSMTCAGNMVSERLESMKSMRRNASCINSL